jgi:uncharacterized protein (DUF952 family)
MSVSRIYHLCREADWKAAAALGCYEGSEQDRADGFLHFSTSEQIQGSAARHRAGEEGLLLLVVETGLLGEALRWEVASSGDLYPHLYGVVPFESVREVLPLPLGPDGLHQFPYLEP